MKLPTLRLSPHSINAKLISFTLIVFFVIIFIGISLFSMKSSRFSLSPAARNFLGLKKPSSRFCSKLVRHESINWNYYYYYKNPATDEGLIWCKVPKAGSTTLTKLFLRLAGSKNVSNNPRVHKLLRDFYPRLPNNVMLDKMKFSKTFMVARDPFERLLSAYRDKLESTQRDMLYRDGYYHEHYGKFMIKQDHSMNNTNSSDPSISKAVNGTRREPTWNEFVTYLIKTPIARMDEHWQPITRLCSPCSLRFNYIIKLENFDTEIRQPLKDAGITAIDLGKNHITGTANKKLLEKYFHMLTLGEVKKLYTKYKRDFLLFGYSPYKYFRMYKSGNGNGTQIKRGKQRKLNT